MPQSGFWLSGTPLRQGLDLKFIYVTNPTILHVKLLVRNGNTINSRLENAIGYGILHLYRFSMVYLSRSSFFIDSGFTEEQF